MRPQGLPEIPAMTAAVAGAAFPSGSPAMRARDELAGVFTDEPFADAFGVRGPAGLSPGMLALVTVLQFTENLTDRQAALMAVRAIDWKYALGREAVRQREADSDGVPPGQLRSPPLTTATPAGPPRETSCSGWATRSTSPRPATPARTVLAVAVLPRPGPRT